MTIQYPHAVVYKLSHGNDAFISSTVDGVPPAPTAAQMAELRSRLVFHMRTRLYRNGYRPDGTTGWILPYLRGMSGHPSYLALDRVGFDKLQLDILEHCPCDEPGQAMKRATAWRRREKPNLNARKS